MSKSKRVVTERLSTKRLISALFAGKELQWNGNGEWQDSDNDPLLRSNLLVLNNKRGQYRLKPKVLKSLEEEIKVINTVSN